MLIRIQPITKVNIAKRSPKSPDFATTIVASFTTVVHFTTDVGLLQIKEVSS